MAGFDDVILRALEKQQPASIATREQVYNSARSTLANMLRNSENLSVDVITSQQQLLEDAILRIEAGYNNVEPEQPEVRVNISPDTEAEIPPEIQTEIQTHAAAHASAHTQLPTSSVAPPVEVVDHPEKLAAPTPRSFWQRPFALLLFGTIILAALGITAWWIYDQNLTMPAEMRDHSVPNPPKILPPESSSADEDTSGGGVWLTIFETGDPIGLITPASSTAILSKDNNGAFVRLKSAGGDLQRNFKFVVEPGILKSVTDKAAIFELVAKSSTSDNQQFIITCQFGTMGDCGRNRFTTGRKPKTFIIKKDFSGLKTESSATISVIVDISGRGAPLDIYLLRVKTR